MEAASKVIPCLMPVASRVSDLPLVLATFRLQNFIQVVHMKADLLKTLCTFSSLNPCCTLIGDGANFYK